MANAAKKAIITALVEGVLTYLMIQTSVEQVLLSDGSTLAAKLAEMVTAINQRAKTADVTTQINTAISELIGGAPETADTLKELYELINTNKDVHDALTAAIGGKADKTHTHDAMTAATSSTAGKSGMVPAPAAGAQGKYLRGDGTWQTPPNTTYQPMTAATASAAGTQGLVPAPAAGKQTAFLRGDGTWAVPANTTYTVATTAKDGLMSKTDKAKLDGVKQVYVSATQPTNLAEGDLWLHVVE